MVRVHRLGTIVQTCLNTGLESDARTHNSNVFETKGCLMVRVHRQGTIIQTCLNTRLESDARTHNSNVLETQG